jgi:hypothetical protein
MFGSAPPQEISESLETEAEADSAEAELDTDRALAQQLVSWGGSPGKPLALAPAAAREAVEAAEDDPRGAAAVDVGDEALDIEAEPPAEAVLAADRALA